MKNAKTIRFLVVCGMTWTGVFAVYSLCLVVLGSYWQVLTCLIQIAAFLVFNRWRINGNKWREHMKVDPFPTIATMNKKDCEEILGTVKTERGLMPDTEEPDVEYEVWLHTIEEACNTRIAKLEEEKVT